MHETESLLDPSLFLLGDIAGPLSHKFLSVWLPFPFFFFTTQQVLSSSTSFGFLWVFSEIKDQLETVAVQSQGFISMRSFS